MVQVENYKPVISIHEAFGNCIFINEELVKIYNFIDLPDHVKAYEKQNASVIRNYYANLLDGNLVDLNTVKDIIEHNKITKNLNEKAVSNYYQAEKYLTENSNSRLSLELFYKVFGMLNTNESEYLFSLTTDIEEDLAEHFEFLNLDTEFHPILQSWMLNFKILQITINNKINCRLASLFQNFWLLKHNYSVNGLLGIEHDLYLNKQEFSKYFYSTTHQNLNEQIVFGLKIHLEQLGKIKLLLRSYFRKQIGYEKMQPRQKNIMNYVFEQGYKLKEVNESILNKRQKLIMYIVQHKGFVSTKELVPMFDCNRKTIQRDFNLLLEFGFVKAIGAGAGLKYSVNLSENLPKSFMKYQSSYLSSN
ncbi:MAG: DeoR family transcriptional regulator [Bacteroidia bacterium]